MNTTTEVTADPKSAVVINFMEALQKMSGGKWFKDNEMTLKEKLEASLSLLPPFAGVQVKEDDPEPPTDDLFVDTEKEALRIQLGETLSAHETLNTEYQAAHKALIDLAVVCVGGLEKLKEQAPLTIEKLRDIVANTLDFGKPAIDASGFNSLEWVQARKKNLILIGQGPLASGRYEGEHDCLVQLEQAILRAAPPEPEPAG